jgi:methylisocitrate lyase
LAYPTLQDALASERPLQIVGVIHALAARIAEQSGFKALYLSGAGVANSRLALPDLGLTSLNDVVEEVSRITQATELPLLVDADTGWGNPINIRRAISTLERAGASGVHIEDQADYKRCGHREKKRIIRTAEMCTRIKAALDGKQNTSFMVIARTDALASEELNAVLDRALAYEAQGADAIFVEAVTQLDQYQTFTKALKVPVLANITEFGKTPLFTLQELSQVKVAMVLYPLSAFRAMNAAAEKVYGAIRKEGTQQSVVAMMQDRKALYQLLNYEAFEAELETYLQATENNNGNN